MKNMIKRTQIVISNIKYNKTSYCVKIEFKSHNRRERHTALIERFLTFSERYSEIFNLHQ